MAILTSTIVLALVAAQSAQSASKAPPSALSQQTGDSRQMTLTLSHALQKDETAWLLVEVGVIGREQIQLTTQHGRPLGTVSPLNVRAGQAAGTYAVPVAPAYFDNLRLALRLSVMQSGGASRAPTKQEVKSLRLVIRRLGTSGEHTNP